VQDAALITHSEDIEGGSVPDTMKII